LPDDLALYESFGFRVLKIGEEAIVDLKAFTLKGKPGKNFRTSINKFKKLGYQIEFYQPPIPSELLHQLRNVSDEWLHMMQGSEKKFSLGWFDESYLRECQIVVVRTSQGKLSAFANVVTEYQIDEITIDLMRHRADMENGTMDFLFISMFEYFQEQGYGSFNLGLSALSGVGGSEQAPRLEKGMHYLYKHLNQFYNFKGIHAYKEKFHPRWEPRYLVYPNLPSLPDVVVGLVRADSGDRLLDYFKPGS
jgi:phosphatidylglycerol lysyltransferase